MKNLLLKIIFVYKKLSTAFREARAPLFIYTDCKFYPCCSDYAVKAVNKHGVLKGSAKSFLRILRCSPFSKGGADLP